MPRVLAELRWRIIVADVIVISSLGYLGQAAVRLLAPAHGWTPSWVLFIAAGLPRSVPAVTERLFP